MFVSRRWKCSLGAVKNVSSSVHLDMVAASNWEDLCKWELVCSGIMAAARRKSTRKFLHNLQKYVVCHRWSMLINFTAKRNSGTCIPM